jgi:hypothetical protein
MATVYLKYYGNVYRKETGKDPTVEVLVRIFNGGPTGYKREATKRYATKFAKVYIDNTTNAVATK